MKKIINLWNGLLKKLMVHTENSNLDRFLDEELNKEIENNSIKLLRKRVNKNLNVSENTKDVIVKKMANSFINKKTVEPFDEYLMNNYKRFNISASRLIDLIINDVKYNTDEIKSIMHEVEFFGYVNIKLKKNRDGLLIITPEMVAKETDSDEYKKLIKDLCSTFNMGNELPVKYEMDIADLKIEKISDNQSYIKNDEFIRTIEEQTTLNYAAKQSFLSYSEDKYKKEKWFLSLARDLLNESSISPYETMKKYLNSNIENHRRLAVFLCVVGSHKILKDVTLQDIEKLSENVLAPYYLKFLNSFFSVSKPLYDNPQALEALKEQSQKFVDMENPLFISMNELESENIKQMIGGIVSDLKGLEKKSIESNNFMLHVNNLLKELLDDFITLKELTGKSDETYLTEEIVKIREYVDNSIRSTLKDKVEDLKINQKIMKSQIKKGV